MLDFSKISTATVKVDASDVPVCKAGGNNKTKEERAENAEVKLQQARDAHGYTLAAAIINIADAKLTEEKADTLYLKSNKMVEAAIKVLLLEGHERARARLVAHEVATELFGKAMQGKGLLVSRERIVAILTPAKAAKKAAKAAKAA